MKNDQVEKQVGLTDFEIYQSSFSVDTLYKELQRIASYFDSLGINFYAGVTDNRMFCVEGQPSLMKSQGNNKDLLHFQTGFDGAQIGFWFHFVEVDGEERLLIRQKGFDGDVLNCCCELIPGDCLSNPFPVCENSLENVDHYAEICEGRRKDYRFLVEGNYYKTRKKVFVCPKNYPVEITIVDAKTKLPIDTVFNWKVNGNVNTEKSHTISIGTVDLNSNLAELEVEFTVKKGPKYKNIALKLDVRNDIEVKFIESTNTTYAFDENKIDTFREFVGYGEKAETPWLFIESGKMDEVLAEVNKSNHYYAVNTIESNQPQLIVSPIEMTNGEQEIQLSHSGSGHEIYEVFACDSDEPELLIYTGDKKEYYVDFYYICETNDDIQVNPQGSAVQNSWDVCIDGGSDGLIDNVKRLKDIENDSLVIYDQGTSNEKHLIFAGKDLVCNSKKEINDTICPQTFSVNNLLTVCNNIYQRVGVDFALNIDFDTIYLNYDWWDDDGICQYQHEENIINLYVQTILPNSPQYSIAFAIKDLGVNSYGDDVMGKAFGGELGTRYVGLDTEDGRTLAHEFGHAVFSLLHPGSPRTGQFGIDDWNNFMHGVSQDQYNTRVNSVRRYHFGLIRDESE